MTTPREELDILRQLDANPNPRQELELLRSLDEGQAPAQAPTAPFFEFEEEPIDSPAGGELIDIPEGEEQPLTSFEKAVAAGVDVRTGAPVSRLPLGFAPNEQFAADFMEKQLSKKFGQPIEIRKGEASGELEFFNPETNLFTTFDESGLTVNDLKEIVGPAITAGGDIAGSILGFIVGLPSGPGVVATETAGAAGGTFLGEQARLRIGRRMGIADLTDEQINQIAREEAATAGAATLLTSGALRGGARILKGSAPISKGFAHTIETESAKNADTIAQINKRISGEFAPPASRRAGLPQALELEAGIRREPSIEAAFRRVEEVNERALEEFYDTSLGGLAAREATGRQVQREARGLIGVGTQATRASEKAAIRESRQGLGRIKDLDEPLAGKDVRESLVSAQTVAKNAEDTAWEKTRATSGYNPDTASSNIKIPRTGETNRVLKSLSAESRKALIGGEAVGKERLINRLMRRGEGDEITILDKNGDELLTIEKDFAVEDFDIVQLNSAISHLKRQIRVSSKGFTAEDPTIRDAQRLLSSLEKPRNTWLTKNNPKLMDEILEAEALTSKRANTFDRSFAGSIIREESPGKFVLSDREAFNKIFVRNNGDAAQEIVSIISGNPTAIQTIRNHIYSLYRSSVEKNGVVSPDLHDKFLREFSDTIRPFFTKSDFDKLGVLGETGKVVEKAGLKVARIEKAFKKSFLGKIDSMNPESISDAFWGAARGAGAKGTLNVADARKLRNLTQSVGTFKGTRDLFADELKRRIFKEGNIDTNALSTILEKQGDKIGAFFGGQYRRDLQILLKGAQVAQTSGKALPEVGISGWLMLFRAGIGAQLSRRQRILSGGLTVNANKREIIVADALLDPDKLHALAINGGKRIGTKNLMTVFSSLAAIDLEQEIPPTTE